MNELGFLSIEEAAKLLRVSEDVLRKLRVEEGLPFVKFGKRIFFKREALVQFIDDQQYKYEKTGD